MCTLILLHNPTAPWPLLAAANRDEMLARPWLPPAQHWPGIAGGKDSLAGGTWLAINTHGVMAGILNRTGSLGPAPGKLSRGDLPLLALAHPTAARAAQALATLDAALYRPFNLVIADSHTAHVLRGTGDGPVQAHTLPPGLHMVTASDPNDTTNPRVARHLPRFAAAAPPSPPDWGAWPDLLADSAGAWPETLNVPPAQGFGTASSALLAIRPGQTCFLFAPGPPHQAAFAPIPPTAPPPQVSPSAPPLL